MVPRRLRGPARAEGGPADAPSRGARRGGSDRGLTRRAVRAQLGAGGVSPDGGGAGPQDGGGGPILRSGAGTAARVRAPVPRRAGERLARGPRAAGGHAAAATPLAGSVPRDPGSILDGGGGAGRERAARLARGGQVPGPRGRLPRADPRRRAVPRAPRAVP